MTSAALLWHSEASEMHCNRRKLANIPRFIESLGIGAEMYGMLVRCAPKFVCRFFFSTLYPLCRCIMTNYCTVANAVSTRCQRYACPKLLLHLHTSSQNPYSHQFVAHSAAGKLIKKVSSKCGQRTLWTFCASCVSKGSIKTQTLRPHAASSWPTGWHFMPATSTLATFRQQTKANNTHVASVASWLAGWLAGCEVGWYANYIPMNMKTTCYKLSYKSSH